MNRILITGATGFIGGRLAELAFHRKIRTVCLVRSWSRAARLSRLPVEMVSGDIRNSDSLRTAMKGCEVVFHCAVDNRSWGEEHRRAGVEGTNNVMQAALDTGVRRVIHLSSVAVYSYRPGRDSTKEDTSYRYSGDPYCDGKIDAEKVALRYHREFGLPVTVLRPTIVYGPFGDYTIQTVNLIRQGRMALLNGGAGICNCLYVDNLVEAMFESAAVDSSAGETFHISDSHPVTWREFIESHAMAIGSSFLPLRELNTAELEAARSRMSNHTRSSLRQTLKLMSDPRTRAALYSIPVVHRSATVGRSIAKFLMPRKTRQRLRESLAHVREGTAGGVHSDSPQPMSPAEELMLTAFDNVVFSIDKARRLLGYNPRIEFLEGMRRTAEWIKWARL